MSRYVIAKYIRLSLEDSKYDSLSIPNQRLLLDSHIDSLGIDDAEVLEFVDNGYTGKFHPPSDSLFSNNDCNVAIMTLKWICFLTPERA